MAVQPKQITTHWQKTGCIWKTPNHNNWMVSHAANPIAHHRYDDVFRVYFSCRDDNNVSSIGWFDIDLTAPDTILDYSKQPVLSPGQLGAFDDSGVSIGSVIAVGDTIYLYYMGWNLGVTVPWRNSIGLAVSNDNGESFEKVSPVPILDRNPEDPFTLSYPWVMYDETNSQWRMWYGSNLKWGKDMADMDHVIKYAESSDGLNWWPQGQVVGIEQDGEYAFAKPCVVYEEGLYHMWYAYRGEAYRIGYATSVNGKDWERRDSAVGMDVSLDGWDSEMLCYPNVFKHHQNYYMLYNGNAYGKTGIGLAKCSGALPQW